MGLFRKERRPPPVAHRPAPAPAEVPFYAPPPPPEPVGRFRVGPGHVVWTAVHFVDQPGVAKDRPVLIVGREPGMLLVLTMTTQERRAGHREWYPIGSGDWDRQRRPSWVRMHPYYRMRDTDVRRPGGVVDRATFDALRVVLAKQYGWTFPSG